MGRKTLSKAGQPGGNRGNGERKGETLAGIANAAAGSGDGHEGNFDLEFGAAEFDDFAVRDGVI